ncbi:MAG TPA: RND transporter, partial [Hyphomicrobiaceae bacterium]|nr:RND transporter [Hyphomicrobiaceae bacterium]
MFGLLLLALVATVSPKAIAHEGHDHGAPPPPVSKTIAPRADTSSNDFEVVVVARGPTIVVHVDTFRSNEPVEGATLEVDTPAGVLKPAPVPKEPGTYSVAAPFAAKPGKYDLAITVTAKETVDILAATLVVPEPANAAEQAVQVNGLVGVVRKLGQGLADLTGLMWAYVIAAFILGAIVSRVLWPKRATSAAISAATVTALTVFVTAALTSPVKADTGGATDSGTSARDIAQRFADGAVFVPKPTQRILALRTIFTELAEHRRTIELPGRIVPSPNASGLVQASVGGRLFPPPGGFKALGTRVKAGDILAFVRPPLSLADATAQAQQARELDQQISIVTRKVERLRSIEKVIAKSQLEDAELELKGLTTRRANLDRVKSEPEALVAPVDGILAAANAVAGQMAEPNAVIFHII